MNSLLYHIFLLYFVTHIPITALMDFQIIWGDHYPPALQTINTWYLASYKDPLITVKPVWFKSFIWLEAAFQMPFFFYAVYALVKKDNAMR